MKEKKLKNKTKHLFNRLSKLNERVNDSKFIALLRKLFKNSMFIEVLSFIWLAAAVFAGIIVYATYLSYLDYGLVWRTIKGVLLSVALIATLLYLLYELLSTQEGGWFSSSFF